MAFFGHYIRCRFAARSKHTYVHQMQMVVNHFQLFLPFVLARWHSCSFIKLFQKGGECAYRCGDGILKSLCLSPSVSLSFFAAEALAGAAADNPGGES